LLTAITYPFSTDGDLNIPIPSRKRKKTIKMIVTLVTNALIRISNSINFSGNRLKKFKVTNVSGGSFLI
jgi:hypothetical protein